MVFHSDALEVLYQSAVFFELLSDRIAKDLCAAPRVKERQELITDVVAGFRKEFDSIANRNRALRKGRSDEKKT
jgi:hypothetical protein